MDLMNMLLASMTSSASTNSLSKKSGLSTKVIVYLLSLALPQLIKAMTSNASTQQGAASLLSALTQHKSNTVISQQIEEADTADGTKIIGHILGNSQTNVFEDLAKQTGATTDQVSTVLSAIAPALLSGVSAASTSAAAQAKAGIDLSDGLDLSDIIGMFSGAQTQPQQQTGVTGTSLLNILSGLMK